MSTPKQGAARPAVLRSLKHVGVFLVWNLVVGVPLLFLQPAIALPLVLALYLLLVRGYALGGGRRRGGIRRWAMLRLRALRGPALRWALVSLPVILLLSWALGDVYTRLVPVPPESLNPFEARLTTWEGRLMISVFAIGIAPVVEEFFFRGLIQWELERRYGPVRGIAGAAALFAFVHVLPWVLPLHFFLGVAFGFAVWATRSIWTGVLLHATNNAAAMIGFAAAGEEPAPTGTLWELGLTRDLWTSLLTLALLSLAAAWTAAGMLRLRRGSGLQPESRAMYLA